MSETSFYRAFEEAFRGGREEILQRLDVYRDFVAPFVGLEKPALDLGCGRGEWLELMRTLGIAAHGVDLDEGMLAGCYELGLSAERRDAIEQLQSLPDASQSIVSGFHIAEHLPFEVLQQLIIEAHRVLMPGGLLILETPNPENPRVGTLGFHMDPTHNKPLPPGLLSFLPQHYGFKRTKVLRLQESARLSAAPEVTLFQVFEGVSPDYAIVSQKAGDPQFTAKFDAAFAQDHGLTLESLTQRFEDRLASRAEVAAVQAEIALARASAKTELLRLQSDLVRQQQATAQLIDDTRAHIHEQFQREITERIDVVYASTSWRITAPLRALVTLLRSPKTTLKSIARRSGSRAMHAIHARPALHRVVMAGVRQVPGLESRLRGALQQSSASAARGFAHRALPVYLSPRGLEIFDELKTLQGPK